MLITFLLLAVLTIGAVSASDDVSSDNLTVSDDVDAITDDNKYADDEIWINDEEMEIDENNPEFDSEYDDELTEIASITLPEGTEGKFQILNNEEIIVDSKVNEEDYDHWSIDDEDGSIEGTIYLIDIISNINKINDGDNLTFRFLELSGESNYVVVNSLTKVCTVSLTDTTMQLTEIGSIGMTDEDVDFQVKNIDYNKPNENFTYITVTQIAGIFIISIDDTDEDYIELLNVDLSETDKPYVKISNENGTFYRFGFSFADINDYIYGNNEYANSFKELVDNNLIDSEGDMYFELYEYDEETEIDSKTMAFTRNENGISFEDEEEDDEDAVEVEYLNLHIVMHNSWEENELLEFTVKNGIDGKIVIYLNDDETPAFKSNISDLTPTDLSDDEFSYYIIYVGDLNICQAGEYIIRDYFDYKNGTHIYQYDDEDPETLVLYDSQNITVNGVELDVNPTPTTINGNESFITIDSSASEYDEISVYVDGNETPTIITLKDCDKDENGNYIIGTKQLNLGAGEHNLNITYNGTELNAKVNLESNLVIELPDKDETIYTTFDDSFVSFRLKEGEIYESKINGTVNLIIKDSAGNIIDTLEENITELYYNEESRAYEIRTGDVDAELNGKYIVIVQYSKGNEADTKKECNVTFKSFEAKEYGTSIKGIIKGENDYAITFSALPLTNNIIIIIDGNKIEIDESDLGEWFDQENGVYFIKSDKLGKLEDGSHSINIYIDTDNGYITLASGTILIDLKANINPELTITVSNIEEGNAANIVITTNATFSGNVTVQVADKNYTVNVDKGHGNTTIPGLKADTYTATAFFKSDGIFADSVKTTTFKVTSKATTPTKKADVIKLTLKKVKVKKSAKKLIIKATLKINGKVAKGKQVIFKFKGKTYKAKTNKKGVAKATIKKKVLKKLKVGKKVTYTAKYLTKTVKKTVKVRK